MSVMVEKKIPRRRIKTKEGLNAVLFKLNSRDYYYFYYTVYKNKYNLETVQACIHNIRINKQHKVTFSKSIKNTKRLLEILIETQEETTKLRGVSY